MRRSAHLRTIAGGVDVPVNADFEGGFAVEPADVAANVAAATQSGVAGLSIEDSTGDAERPLFDFALAVERIQAARRAIDESGRDIVLTGRSEGFIVGRPDLAETIRRLSAYADAGADCLYAPGLRTTADIAAVVKAVAPRPVNVLAGSDFATVAELASAGRAADQRRRRAGARGLDRVSSTAAREIAERGTFAGLGRAVPFAEINASFASPTAKERRLKEQVLPNPLLGRDALIEAITTFLTSQDEGTLGEIRETLEREIDAGRVGRSRPSRRTAQPMPAPTGTTTPPIRSPGGFTMCSRTGCSSPARSSSASNTWKRWPTSRSSCLPITCRTRTRTCWRSSFIAPAGRLFRIG